MLAKLKNWCGNLDSLIEQAEKNLKKECTGFMKKISKSES